MRRIHVVATAVVCAAICGLIFACSTSTPSDALHDDGALTVPTGSEVVGTLSYGQVSAITPYTSVPRYRAYLFDGNPGDHVDIWVRSPDGVADAWLERPSGDPVAYDFAAQHDAHLDSVLDTSGAFAVVFREASFSTSTFTVSLAQVSIPVTDGGPDDAGSTDVSNDAVDGLADATDADDAQPPSGITCTFSRTNQNVSGCSFCSFPSDVSATDNNVAVLIDHTNGAMGSGIYWNGRVLHINGPTTIGSSGWWYGNAFDLSYGDGTSQDAGPDAGETYRYSGVILGTTNSQLNANIDIAGGDQVTLNTFNGSVTPGVANCSVIHGCYRESITCSGSATATQK